MLARIEDTSIIATQALMAMQERTGGEVRGGKLYPIAPALSAFVRPEFEGAALQRRFYLLQAAPQQERKIVDALDEIKIAAYCPLEPKSVRVNMVRRRTVMRPMMPGYVFPSFDEHRDHWEKIPSMDGVVRLFMLNMRPVPIPDEAIERMREREAEALLKGKPVKAPAYVAQPGQWVQIDDGGPWTGFVAQVTDLIAKGSRLLVALDLFGRKTLVEISVTQVRAM